MLNSFYENIQNTVQHRKFYKKWINKIEVAYNYMLNSIDELYELKENFDPETSMIYVSKLMDYHSKLKQLYLAYVNNKHLLTEKQITNNYNVIENEVKILLGKYDEFTMFLSVIEDMKKYHDIKIPSNVYLLDEEK